MLLQMARFHSFFMEFLVSFCILAVVNNAAMNKGVCISFLVFLFSLDKYPGVELLDHIM